MKNEEPVNESRTFKLLSSILNFRAWIDYDRSKAALKYITDGLKRLFVPQVQQARDFEEVVEEYGLTEETLQKRAQSLRKIAIRMLFIACLIFAYTIYLLFTGIFMAFILSLVVTCIALTVSFRYHFWYFQIKQRKLGCTIGEWYRIGIKGEKE